MGVVGVSARAAVQSLARAGCSAWAVDLFADADLQRLARVHRCPPQAYPHALPSLAAHFPASPFLYTGGLENYPEVIADLMTIHELWGNCPEIVCTVRDPWQLAQRFPEVIPPVLPQFQACPNTGRWLYKPLRSAGGIGIRFAQPGEKPDARHYLQQYQSGVAASAVCLDDRCLGVTQQLLGRTWLHARGFTWCGNVGPRIDDPEVLSLCQHWCQKFQQTYGLQGIWGYDFIRHREGISVVEINPRYPASVEVLEHAYTQAALTGEVSPTVSPHRFVAKAIYYAPRDLCFPEVGPWLADLQAVPDPWRWATFADIPSPGTFIPRHRPVLTLLARSSTLSGCVAGVQRLAAQLDQLLGEISATTVLTTEYPVPNKPVADVTTPNHVKQKSRDDLSPSEGTNGK